MVGQRKWIHTQIRELHGNKEKKNHKRQKKRKKKGGGEGKDRGE